MGVISSSQEGYHPIVRASRVSNNLLQYHFVVL